MFAILLLPLRDRNTGLDLSPIIILPPLKIINDLYIISTDDGGMSPPPMAYYTLSYSFTPIIVIITRIVDVGRPVLEVSGSLQALQGNSRLYHHP
jgi:hypothetical protein